MNIRDVVERARREPPRAHPGDPFPDVRYVCKVLDPVPWDRGEVERALGIEIPSDLAELWNICGGLILCEDDTFQQWGLVIHAPPAREFFTLNSEYHKDKGDRALSGDLIFGRFWGDRERSLIRSDKASADFGTIVIVTEIGPRSEWPTVAGSLEEFLVRFMDAHGEKYWEHEDHKKLPEHENDHR